MRLLNSFILFLLFFCFKDVAVAQTGKKQLHLYILMGQSNMAGRGKVTGELETLSHPRVFMLDANGEWQPAKNPVHFDKPKVAGVGPGLSFGIEMAQLDSTVEVGLVPCAVGGTSIEKWQSGAYDAATKTHPYDDAVVRIKKAMENGVVKGMIWHQGEANSSSKDSTAYINKLKDVIDRVRTLTNNSKLPVVIGELGQYKEQYQQFNKILAQVPGKIPFTALATSEGLIHNGDNTHFDGNSANEYGKRYAVEMKKLQKATARK
ncbi:MAG: sialate O-acetylesterase [Pedobacter sp.]|uniref:sialate O-acetylesterase n=1 Tax=Pedobacter sp. TaxID=1411316 RepID=UPI002807169A|nr:sialate O-acetylesterase [Pedobacter sp.]MDQ8005876.1 sialate O-acetylesterase [Pedobacter sp.]